MQIDSDTVSVIISELFMCILAEVDTAMPLSMSCSPQ